MRLLIVEDVANFAEELAETIRVEIPEVEVVVAGDAASAGSAIENEVFDYALCDLKIPATPGTADEIEHGRSVVARILSHSPGTPVLVLSAFADKFENLRDLVGRAGREDIHGTRTDYVMVDAVVKDRVTEAIDILKAHASQLRALEDIDVQARDDTVLTREQIRVLRIFGRRSGGRIVKVRRIGGGLSTASTLEVEVLSDSHEPRASVVAKLDLIRAVRDERERFHREITARLVEGTFAPFADAVTGGCGPHGGLFFRLLEGFGKPLLDLLREPNAKAIVALQRLRALERPWTANASFDSVRIGEIRSREITDPELVPFRKELATMRSGPFEDRLVNIRFATQHRDMHGLNVLMNRESPQLVDYARVERSFGGVDAIALELSLAFHPSIRSDTWPSVDNARAWADPIRFAQGSPYVDVIKFCREWAVGDAGSERAVCAVAYAWALRQLQFEGVRTEIALAIADACIRAYGT